MDRIQGYTPQPFQHDYEVDYVEDPQIAMLTSKRDELEQTLQALHTQMFQLSRALKRSRYVLDHFMVFLKAYNAQAEGIALAYQKACTPTERDSLYKRLIAQSQKIEQFQKDAQSFKTDYQEQLDQMRYITFQQEQATRQYKEITQQIKGIHPPSERSTPNIFTPQSSHYFYSDTPLSSLESSVYGESTLPNTPSSQATLSDIENEPHAAENPLDIQRPSNPSSASLRTLAPRPSHAFFSDEMSQNERGVPLPQRNLGTSR
jgi:ABC-type transporter Mla subunit MlaD